MRISRWPALAAVAAVLAGAPAAATAQAAKPVLIDTQAALEIDAAGRVAAVETGPDLPPLLRERTVEAIRAWRFVPVQQHGRAVGGTTYANVQLCLVPAGEGFSVGVDMTGNGPGTLKDRGPPAPPIPPGILSAAKDGLTFEGRIRYRVEPDGRARLESAELADPALQRRYGTGWRRAVKTWLVARRDRPERIDGVPTATTLEMPVRFELAGERSAQAIRREMARYEAEYAQRAEACRAAAAPPGSAPAVALDSAFVRVPGG